MCMSLIMLAITANFSSPVHFRACGETHLKRRLEVIPRFTWFLHADTGSIQ